MLRRYLDIMMLAILYFSLILLQITNYKHMFGRSTTILYEIQLTNIKLSCLMTLFSISCVSVYHAYYFSVYYLYSSPRIS